MVFTLEGTARRKEVPLLVKRAGVPPTERRWTTARIKNVFTLEPRKGRLENKNGRWVGIG